MARVIFMMVKEYASQRSNQQVLINTKLQMMHMCSHCSPKYKVYISNGSDEESDEKKKIYEM